MGSPKGPRKGPLGPTQGVRRSPCGAIGFLGPEALRAGGLGKHGRALPRAILTGTD